MNTIVMISLPRDIVTWFSQTLMIELIERFWFELTTQIGVSFKTIRAHPNDLGQYSEILSSADLIVFSWNGPVFLNVLRGELKVSTPFLFYLAGEAGRGFAYSGSGTSWLRSYDHFICVSTVEQKMLRSCFSSPKSIISPYPYLIGENEKTRCIDSKLDNQTRKILYIGRYSEQKNLHVLLWALRLCLDRNPGLEFNLEMYGFEDGLGSPNMRLSHPGYLEYLRDLVVSLSLEDRVRWHGFVSNQIIKEYIQEQPHILVSPSLFSDECFGLVPFDSLVRGNRVILTEWGGYLDLKKNFPLQVETVKVYGSKAGPFICPIELSLKIEQSLSRPSVKVRKPYRIPRFYQLEAIKLQVLKLLEDVVVERQNKRRLQFTSWLKNTQRQIRILNPDLSKSMRRQCIKVYKSYEDPLAHHAFKNYGMSSKKRFLNRGKLKSASVFIPPWVKVEKNSIRIEDPHRGAFRRDRSGRASRGMKVRILRDQQAVVHTKDAKWLFERGYLFY